MLSILAGNDCDNGPCPTFHNAPDGVVVQAHKITDPDLIPEGMPDHEDAVFIPTADWEALQRNLAKAQAH